MCTRAHAQPRARACRTRACFSRRSSGAPAAPKAYCEDHLPLDSELLGGEVERFVALGFGAVKQACYCLCSTHCKEVHQQRDEAEMEKGTAGADDDDEADDDDDAEDDEDEDEEEDEEEDDDNDDDDDDGDEEEEEDGPCVALAAGLEGCRGAADDTCEQQPRPAEPRQAGGEDGKADGKGTKRTAHVHDPTPPLPPPPLRPPPASQPSLGRAAAGGMGAGSGGDDESAAMQASQLRSNLLHTLLRWCPRVLLQAEEPELVLLPKPRAALPRSYASAAHYVDANAEYLKLEVQP